MELLYKPDYEEVHKRYKAFWNHSYYERPLVWAAWGKEKRTEPPAAKSYSSDKERWLDIDYRVEQMAWGMENTEYLYDSLPICWPNLGPEIFSACCGCGYEFGASTTWSIPVINDWDTDFEKGRLNLDSPLFKILVDFTQKLIEKGKGKFIVGLSDFHPGGDHIAALRDPQNLAMDMIDNPDMVKKALLRAAPEYFAFYGIFYNMVHSAGMPTTSWTPFISDGTYYIPSNDFSCMVSNKMFEEIFLPGIREECAFLENSIYHLDGPGAIKHLDSLLEIKELDAIQWVPTTGDGAFGKWAYLYKKIQKAGKSLQIQCAVSDLDNVFETLTPEGVCFSSISGVRSREDLEYAVKRITQWK